MTKVLVISTSLRSSSNSDMLAAEFIRGAEESGNQVERISLRGKNIAFCRGCLACQKTQRCVISDDAGAIIAKMKESDAICFATPVYYYGMAGQMKTLLDRANPLYPGEYAFRDIYLVASSADTAQEAMDGTVTGLEGWITCFEKASFKGIARGTGATEPGEVRSNTAAMQQAYLLGKNV